MNVLQRFLNAIQWRPERWRTYVSRKQAGVIVTPDTALAFSGIGACVRILSETMAALPWPVYRRMATGREAAPNHVVNWLLNYQPNPEQTAYVFRRQMLAHYLLWGNGYAEIERGMDGRAIWLWPLMPDRTCIERSETGALIARVRAPDQTYVIPRENVFHLSDGSFDGIMGASRIDLAKRAIGVGIAQDVFAGSYFQNGASVGGVITNKGKTLSPAGKGELLKEFNDLHQGPDRARKTLYLDNGMEYQSIPASDFDFVAQRHFSIEEICRWFGVPQHLVQMLVETNYAISYTADKNFVEHTLRPIAVLHEQEANLRLFGKQAQGSVYSKMNLNGLMRANPKDRSEYYRAMVNTGAMSINEVRELEEMNSIGPVGDEHYLQVNMTTIEKIAEGFPPRIGTPGEDTTPNEADKPGPVQNFTINVPERVTNITVPPSQVHVKAPVNVEGSTLNMPAIEMRVEPQQINVSAPVVNVAHPVVNVAQPIVNVEAPKIEAPIVNVEGARIQVDVPEQPAPIVNIAPAEVKVEAPIVNVGSPVVNVAAAESPIVNVEAPVIHNHVEPNEPAPVRQKVSRDAKGEIQAVTYFYADGKELTRIPKRNEKGEIVDLVPRVA